MNKILLAIALCGAASGQATRIPGPGGASAAAPVIPAFISTSDAQAASGGGTTSPWNPTGANFIICAVGMFKANGTVHVTDSHGVNTYTGGPRKDSSVGNESIQLFYVENATISGSQTNSTDAVFGTITCEAWSGILTSGSIDQTNTGENTSSGTTVQPGSITAAQNNSAVFLAVSNDTNGALSTLSSVATPTMTVDGTLSPAGTAFMVGLAHLLQGTAAAINPTATVGATENSRVAVIADFKP